MEVIRQVGTVTGYLDFRHWGTAQMSGFHHPPVGAISVEGAEKFEWISPPPMLTQFAVTHSLTLTANIRTISKTEKGVALRELSISKRAES